MRFSRVSWAVPASIALLVLLPLKGSTGTGDVNGDGSITRQDILATVDHLTGESILVAQALEDADANQDEALDCSDPVSIESFLAPDVFIDDFEGYSGSDSELQSAWVRVDHGNSVTASLTEECHGGQYAMSYDYTVSSPDYCGLRLVKHMDWSGKDTLRLWLKPDGSGRRLTLQFREGNNEAWESYYVLSGTEPLVLEVPLHDFVHPPWYDGGNEVVDTGDIAQFSIWVNQEAGPTGSGTLLIDDVQIVDAGLPGPTPTPSPSPTPTPRPSPTPLPDGGSGRFEVLNSQIFDPNGEPFIPFGGNVNGYRWVWASDCMDPQFQEAVVDAWHFNCLRVNCNLSGESRNDAQEYDTNNDLKAIVDHYTPQGVVIMLETHEFTCGASGGLGADDAVDRLKAWWEPWVDEFKDNTYVWFNIANEPAGLEWGPEWLSAHQAMIGWLRGEKEVENIIVVDGPVCGQDRGTWWGDCSMPDDKPEASAILNDGPILNSQFENILFAIHTYSQWGCKDDESYNDQLFNAYVDRAHGLGLALIVGETGYYWNESNYNKPFARGFRATMRNAFDRGVGVLFWHLQPGDGFSLTKSGRLWHTDDLTWEGELFWEKRNEGYGLAP